MLLFVKHFEEDFQLTKEIGSYLHGEVIVTN